MKRITTVSYTHLDVYKRQAISLSAACMLLFAALMQAADAFAVQGQTATWGVFGAILKIF